MKDTKRKQKVFEDNTSVPQYLNTILVVVQYEIFRWQLVDLS